MKNIPNFREMGKSKLGKKFKIKKGFWVVDAEYYK